MRRMLLVALIAVLGVFSFGVGSSSVLAADKDCSDFTTQSEAQQYFNNGGGSASVNFNDLDANHNGWACESHFGYVTTANGDIPYPSDNFPDYPGPAAPTTVPTDVVIVPTTAPGEPTTVPAVTPTTDPGATPVTTNPGGGSSNSGGNAGGGSNSGGGTSAVTSLPNTGAGSSSTDTGFVWLALALAGVLGAGAFAYRRSRA